MNYDKSQNETENLSADELKLREMCRSLKKTDAPLDFDFKLKARIASAKPSDFRPRYGFLFRYALPALAVILVLGLLAFNSAFFSPGNNRTIAEGSVVVPNPATPPNGSSFAPPVEEVRQPDAIAAISNSDAQKAPEKPQPQVAGVQTQKKDLRKENKDSDIRSKDFALTAEKTRQFNFNSNSVVPKPQDVQRPNSVPVKEILLFIGINADLENGKWKVRSVKANSIGETPNVKENDIIESIDDQPISAETVLTRAVKGNTITVTRGGEKLQLNLRGKQ